MNLLSVEVGIGTGNLQETDASKIHFRCTFDYIGDLLYCYSYSIEF